MDLLSISSASQYAKNMARRTQWNLKKQSGDFAGHKKSLGDYVNMTKASSVLPQDETDHKMSSIMAKAQAGKKLSPDDWEYLKQKNPTLYEKLREAEQEQENYEKALRRCKTKDEAQRLHMSKLGDIMTAAKNVDEGAIYRLNRLTRSMIAFTESDEYHELPTEAEEAIARESERQAERDALREEAQREAKTETESESESVSETGTDADAESVSDTQAETVSEKKADAAPKPDAKPKFKPAPEVKTPKKPAPETKSVPAFPKGTAEKEKLSGTPTPVVSPGQRAYMNQRDAKPRRREIDAKA